MMARRAAVVVEVDAVVDGGLDEAQHLGALLLDGVAVVVRLPFEAEVDAEAGAEALDVGGDLVLGEELGEAGEEQVGDGMNVIVKTRRAIGLDGRCAVDLQRTTGL